MIGRVPGTGSGPGRGCQAELTTAPRSSPGTDDPGTRRAGPRPAGRAV
jgi:hypothetical protein